MEIELWHLWHGDSGALIQEFVQEFNQKNEWGIKVISEYREHGLPATAQLRDFTEAGGLMSYGHETQDSFFRLAYFIDRLLKGAKPAELPVEQGCDVQAGSQSSNRRGPWIDPPAVNSATRRRDDSVKQVVLRTRPRPTAGSSGAATAALRLLSRPAEPGRWAAGGHADWW